MTSGEPEREQVAAQLERIVRSRAFAQSDRSIALLRYLVDRSQRADGERLKEYTVGVEALGRPVSFDPRTDPIVRAEASRLRTRLERYYAGEGQHDLLLIELPKGGYTVRCTPRELTPGAQPDVSMVSGLATEPETGVATRTVPRRVLTFVAMGCLFLAGRWSLCAPPGQDVEPEFYDVMLQADESIGSEVGTDVAIAPDGSAVVFVSIDSVGLTHLRLRRFDEDTPPIDLPGTRGGRAPFWSPDSRWIAFWADEQLRKVSVLGGSPVVLTDAEDLLGAHWGEDGTIVAALDLSSKLYRISSAAGAPPDVVLDLTAAGVSPRWPQLLPDGRAILYTAVTTLNDDLARIEIASLDDGQRHVLAERGTFGRYVASGHVTYVNQGTLYAIPFDVSRRRARGAPVPVLRDVAYSSTFGYAQLSFSSTGTMVYRADASAGQSIVARVDAAGRAVPLLTQAGRFEWPALSPDGRRLAVASVESGEKTLRAYDVERGSALWALPGLTSPLWTRDGRHVIARSDTGLVTVRATGGQAATMFKDGSITVPWSVSPDDRSLAFARYEYASATAFDLWTVELERGDSGLRARRASPLLRGAAFETYPAVSPDGRWLAYSSNESDAVGVSVRSLRDTSIKVLVAQGGRAPRWSRTGQRLFFTTATRQVMSTTYTVDGDRFVPGRPTPFAPIRLFDSGVLPNYDVGADEQSIVALLPSRQPVVNQVRVVRGFPAMLKQLAP